LLTDLLRITPVQLDARGRWHDAAIAHALLEADVIVFGSPPIKSIAFDAFRSSTRGRSWRWRAGVSRLGRRACPTVAHAPVRVRVHALADAALFGLLAGHAGSAPCRRASVMPKRSLLSP
jgi:hypothetical protein